MKICYFLPFLANSAALADLFPVVHDVSHAWGVRRAPPDSAVLPSHFHEKRETRETCNPWFMNGEDGPGELEGGNLDIPRAVVTERNFMLRKRTMTLPVRSMAAFYMRELSRASPIIWEIGSDNDPDDINTADFSAFKDVAVSYGTRGLCGCTVLVLISKKGVYVAHYWENIAFAPADVYLKIYGNPDRAFQQTVIRGLTRGVGFGDQQASLTGVANQIDDDSILGILMIPKDTHDGIDDGYRNRWNQIKDTVGSIIPALKPSLDAQGHETNEKWMEYRYDAIPIKDERHRRTAIGKILVKYDPDHGGQKKISIWIEGSIEPFYNLEW